MAKYKYKYLRVRVKEKMRERHFDFYFSERRINRFGSAMFHLEIQMDGRWVEEGALTLLVAELDAQAKEDLSQYKLNVTFLSPGYISPDYLSE